MFRIKRTRTREIIMMTEQQLKNFNYNIKYTTLGYLVFYNDENIHSAWIQSEEQALKVATQHYFNNQIEAG